MKTLEQIQRTMKRLEKERKATSPDSLTFDVISSIIATLKWVISK